MLYSVCLQQARALQAGHQGSSQPGEQRPLLLMSVFDPLETQRGGNHNVVSLKGSGFR